MRVRVTDNLGNFGKAKECFSEAVYSRLQVF
jgi:hypothetical protein